MADFQISDQFVNLSVKQILTITHFILLKNKIHLPLHASVTFYEASAPEKLPFKLCPLVNFSSFDHAIPTSPKQFAFKSKDFKSSHVSYKQRLEKLSLIAVKVHRVFPSSR